METAMSNHILEQLTIEHHNTQSLLNVLERQLLSVQKENSPDYELMHQIIDYLSNPIGTYHYPIEELLAALPARNSWRPELQSHLMQQQHAELLEQGKELCNTVQLILEEQWVLRDDLLSIGLSYVGSYRNHMRRERNILFSAVPADLTRPTKGPSAPLKAMESGESQRAAIAFKAIKDRLIAEGAGSWPWKSPSHQHCAVCS